MVSFLAVVVWAFNNFYKFAHCQQQNRLVNGLNQSVLAPLLSMFNLSAAPPGPDPDTMDDLAVGELPPARRDYRKLSDPLKEPSRRWTSYPTGGHVSGMFNVPTQGYYPSYQMMGYLNNPDDPDRMLKLFGRRKDSHRYEYYTIHHDDPGIKIPLKIQGEKELYSGDSVTVPGFGNDYKVNTYDYEAPNYNPTVF